MEYKSKRAELLSRINDSKITTPDDLRAIQTALGSLETAGLESRNDEAMLRDATDLVNIIAPGFEKKTLEACKEEVREDEEKAADKRKRYLKAGLYGLLGGVMLVVVKNIDIPGVLGLIKENGSVTRITAMFLLVGGGITIAMTDDTTPAKITGFVVTFIGVLLSGAYLVIQLLN